MSTCPGAVTGVPYAATSSPRSRVQDQRLVGDSIACVTSSAVRTGCRTGFGHVEHPHPRHLARRDVCGIQQRGVVVGAFVAGSRPHSGTPCSHPRHLGSSGDPSARGACCCRCSPGPRARCPFPLWAPAPDDRSRGSNQGRTGPEVRVPRPDQRCDRQLPGSHRRGSRGPRRLLRGPRPYDCSDARCRCSSHESLQVCESRAGATHHRRGDLCANYLRGKRSRPATQATGPAHRMSVRPACKQIKMTDSHP